MEILFLNPVFKEMIWGGDKMKQKFEYDIPSNQTGECWAIAAHEQGDCEILNGQFKGIKLSDLWKEEKALFGNSQGDKFPLLTKIIDAKTDLSIQVHPDDEYARINENGSLGKTECWYVLECEENTTIVIGHNATTEDELKEMIFQGRWQEFIREIPVKAGDFFQIEPGTVHAIKGGTMILETQQNSDITYRVYDYDRLSDGKPRPLHVEKSIDVISVPYVNHIHKEGQGQTINEIFEELVSCKYYTVWKCQIHGENIIIQDKDFMLVSVIEGQGEINGEKIKKGDHFILPYGYGEGKMTGDMTLICSAV